jgi:hypothetical protein
MFNLNLGIRKLGSTREEDEEEEKAVVSVSLYSGEGAESLHYGKAKPLHTDLRNPQQTRNTLKRAHSLTASHISTRCWQHKYIRESACARCCSEEDEEWRDAFRGRARYDSVMLWKV